MRRSTPQQAGDDGDTLNDWVVQLQLKDLVAIITGVTGAVLGIYNFFHRRGQEKVRLPSSSRCNDCVNHPGHPMVGEIRICTLIARRFVDLSDDNLKI